MLSHDPPLRHPEACIAKSMTKALSDMINKMNGIADSLNLTATDRARRGWPGFQTLKG